jgi:hypothetical protein
MTEVALGLISLASTVASMETGHWFATPFAMLFTFGYGYVAWFVTAEQVARRKAAVAAAEAKAAGVPVLAGMAEDGSIPPPASGEEELAA